MQEDIKQKRKILLKAVAVTFQKLRMEKGKSISLAANELNISKSIWSDVELAKNDLQFSTFLRMLEALDVTPELFFAELRANLPAGFCFIEE